MTAYIIQGFGETEYEPLDAIAGALMMQEWSIG
jgi:hypothetical protein